MRHGDDGMAMIGEVTANAIPAGDHRRHDLFFTVNLADRSRWLLVEQVADLREVVWQVRQTHPFDILAWCVLPEHLHGSGRCRWGTPIFHAHVRQGWLSEDWGCVGPLDGDFGEPSQR